MVKKNTSFWCSTELVGAEFHTCCSHDGYCSNMRFFKHHPVKWEAVKMDIRQAIPSELSTIMGGFMANLSPSRAVVTRAGRGA